MNTNAPRVRGVSRARCHDAPSRRRRDLANSLDAKCHRPPPISSESEPSIERDGAPEPILRVPPEVVRQPHRYLDGHVAPMRRTPKPAGNGLGTVVGLDRDPPHRHEPMVSAGRHARWNGTYAPGSGTARLVYLRRRSTTRTPGGTSVRGASSSVSSNSTPGALGGPVARIRLTNRATHLMGRCCLSCHASTPTNSADPMADSNAVQIAYDVLPPQRKYAIHPKNAPIAMP